jgi:hypothetical protein
MHGVVRYCVRENKRETGVAREKQISHFSKLERLNSIAVAALELHIYEVHMDVSKVI